MIQITSLKSRSIEVRFDAVEGAVAYKLTVEKNNVDPIYGFDDEHTIGIDFTEPRRTIYSLKPGTAYTIRLYVRTDISPVYTREAQTIATTPKADYDEMSPDEIGEISLFAGSTPGFSETDKLSNKITCFPSNNVYRTRPDDKGCGSTAPNFNRQTGCCTGADVAGAATAQERKEARKEELFLKALEAIYDMIHDSTAYESVDIRDAVRWVRGNNKAIPRSASSDTFIVLDRKYYWFEDFMKFLFLVGIRKTYHSNLPTRSIRLVEKSRGPLWFDNNFYVGAGDSQMREYMSHKGVNGAVKMSVKNTEIDIVPYISGCEIITYLGATATYFDVTNLPTVLASPKCGFKGKCGIIMFKLPCALSSKTDFDVFFKNLIFSIVNNRATPVIKTELWAPTLNTPSLLPQGSRLSMLPYFVNIGGQNHIANLADTVLQELAPSINNVNRYQINSSEYIGYTDANDGNHGFDLCLELGSSYLTIRKKRDDKIWM